MVIVFEGHDGSGKTTIIKQLQKELEKLNKEVVTIKCPSEEWKKKRTLVDNKSDLQRSFDFYLNCCFDTSSKIAKFRDKVDYILLDRYYFSTIVSHESRGFNVDRTLFKLLEKVDLKIIIRTNEVIRRNRVLHKKDVQSHDLMTFNSELIHKANTLYSMLGFIPIENDHHIEQAIVSAKKIIVDYAGKL